MTFLSLSILILTPFWLLLSHCLLARIIKSHLPRQRLAILNGLLMSIPYILSLLLIEKSFGAILFSVPVYFLLAHVYFHVFNMSETARRIRILISLREKTSIAGFDSQYTPSHVIETRLVRLLETKHIQKNNDRFLAPKTFFSLVSQIMVCYEKLIFPNRFKTCS